MAKAAKAVPDGYSNVTPILTFDDDCGAAMDWYKRGLNARELSRHTGPDGKIMHAEIQVGNARIMVHDAMMGGKGPKALGGSPMGLWIYVEDCDALYNRAVAAGCEIKQPMDNQFWGDRCGVIKDPYGFAWTIATRKEDVTEDELNQRAAAFFKQAAAQAPASPARKAGASS